MTLAPSHKETMKCSCFFWLFNPTSLLQWGKHDYCLHLKSIKGNAKNLQ